MAATVFVLLTVTFMLFRIMPGDPTSMLLTGRFTEEERQSLLESFGLDAPLHEQYILFIINYTQGDMGTSFFYQEPVLQVIIPRLINTLIIIVPGMATILISAYFTGSYIGWKKGTSTDKIGSYLQLTFRAIPHFILGLFFLLIFSYQLGVTPISGIRPIGYEPTSTADIILTTAHHALLPFLVFTIHYLADAFLLMRGNIIDERDTAYVRFLRLKGVRENKVRKHATRNSLLPLVTYAPTLILISIGGQILIEQVFSWPGIGELLVSSVLARDYPVAQAAFFIFGMMAIIGNTVVDILYRIIDPRVGGDET